MDKEFKKLQEEFNDKYSQLTGTFEGRMQFKLLNELLELNLQLESYCNK